MSNDYYIPEDGNQAQSEQQEYEMWLADPVEQERYRLWLDYIQNGSPNTNGTNEFTSTKGTMT